MLRELRAKLPLAEQRPREEACEQAHAFVDKAAEAGGASSVKKSFPVPPRRDHRRIDIEVNKGVAFVPDTPS